MKHINLNIKNIHNLVKQYLYLNIFVYVFKNSFDTRIYYSDLYIRKSFQNGYRNINPSNNQDYARHLGEIVSIKNLNG